MLSYWSIGYLCQCVCVCVSEGWRCSPRPASQSQPRRSSWTYRKRRVMDEEAQGDSECPVCYESLTDSARTLSCGHDFCHDCLVRTLVSTIQKRLHYTGCYHLSCLQTPDIHHKAPQINIFPGWGQKDRKDTGSATRPQCHCAPKEFCSQVSQWRSRLYRQVSREDFM